MSREGVGHPFRESRAPPFTWQNPKVHTQKHSVLALRDGSHQAHACVQLLSHLESWLLAPEAASLQMVNSWPRRLSTRCGQQDWLAAGYPGKRSPIHSGQGLVPRTEMCLASPGKCAQITFRLRSYLVLFPNLPWWGGVFITRK